MSNRTPRDPFEELSFPRKEIPKFGGRYRVYKDAVNFILVEAENASEAFKNSGLQQPRRIERDAIYLTNVLNLDELSKTPIAAAPTEAEAKPQVPEAAETAAPATPVVADAPAAAAPTTPEAAKPADIAMATPEAPLSTADVDKLLKGENATGA